MKTVVRMSNITKTFTGVHALEDINWDLCSGEVHVILGENGAGKSTLIKLLSGVFIPDKGSITIENTDYAYLTPALAKKLGIGVIYQELSIIDELSLAENIFLGCLPEKKIGFLPVVDNVKIYEQSKIILEKLGLKYNPNDSAGLLSIAEKQLLEIARVFTAKARIIIMDEPTSSLTVEETKKLFAIIQKLKKENAAIVYISHKLEEIPIVGDRVTVLKDGKYIGTKNASDITVDEMISMMVGRELNRNRQVSAKDFSLYDTCLTVNNLSRLDQRVKNISFTLKKGEILGFAGLIGSGRTELMEAIFSVVPTDSKSSIFLNGKKLTHKNPYGALKSRIAFITENRRETGFFGNFSIQENISVSSEILNSKMGGMWGMISPKLDKKVTEQAKKLLNIKYTSANQYITELSGGNQQKCLIGKWLACNPDIFIFDEPTRGIDVGSKSEIYKILRNLADSGKGIIMVSSELPELLFISDRIIVFNKGEITAEMSADSATEENIMRAATGSFVRQKS
ncbi:ATP-binding cassette domain-containing protein [Treponema sp. OMZ 840]|uniref:sugar ABC transporter ATP-binding protein n=1 Tax=Treponema sp. OMZ 840 TaxID=244313 RepID=UPI003D9207CB